jgi:hypothetical protein
MDLLRHEDLSNSRMQLSHTRFWIERPKVGIFGCSARAQATDLGSGDA